MQDLMLWVYSAVPGAETGHFVMCAIKEWCWRRCVSCGKDDGDVTTYLNVGHPPAGHPPL